MFYLHWRNNENCKHMGLSKRSFEDHSVVLHLGHLANCEHVSRDSRYSTVDSSGTYGMKISLVSRVSVPLTGTYVWRKKAGHVNHTSGA
jgi:hypothetical protein